MDISNEQNRKERRPLFMVSGHFYPVGWGLFLSLFIFSRALVLKLPRNCIMSCIPLQLVFVTHQNSLISCSYVTNCCSKRVSTN